MAILKPDKVTTLGGVTINEFLLTNHNPNRIAMPSASMEGETIGVTIHNTDWIKVASGTTPAEQYTRATYNGNMGSVRVHYYVDDVCAWQNLPLTLSGWHAADGNGNGNRKTIAIECIMSPAYNDRDKKSEDNAAKLIAALLKKNGWGIDKLYTHTYWLHVRDGAKGSVDELNVKRHSYKRCPAYIIPHWDLFKAKVMSYMHQDEIKPVATGQIYRIRKSWTDVKSQVGAYRNLQSAMKECPAGYNVFDETGMIVYSNASKFVKGQKVSLKIGTPLFASEVTKNVSRRISGTYYLYDGVACKNGRYRITTEAKYCGRTPMGKYVTGYVSLDNFA